MTVPHDVLERDQESGWSPLNRWEDPYVMGKGGNCGQWRVPDDYFCPSCYRHDGEWHQQGCPNDSLGWAHSLTLGRG